MSATASTSTQSDARHADVALAAARSEVYRWLSLWVRYPDETVRQQLRAPALRTQLLDACQVIDEVDGTDLRRLARQVVGPVRSRDSAALEPAYIQTFGHISRGRLSLYETEYGEGQALRGVHELGDLAGFYRAFGLEVGRRIGERVDHVTVECAFMHVLCYKEAYAMVHHGTEQRVVCREAQARFLREHLGAWLPSVARRILDVRAGSTYTGWARLALRFLATERQRFDLPDVSERLGLRTPEPSLEEGCMSCAVETACPGGQDALALRSTAD